ncbi:MAG TPA: phage virion morphogenesis protein [Cellvibrio sp.]|nr:phage virion morphogenesis protein [Cellvibrio sp.]
MANFELQITNNDIQEFLGGLINRLTDSRPLFAGVAQEFATQTELIFQNEGPGYSATNANIKGRGTAAGGWPQLAPRTIKQRGSAHPILQITGALARSFITDFGADFAALGTNSPYAPIHFFGGQINMPARSQKAYFKRNEKTGDVGNLFVKKKKSNFEQWVTIPAYTINIPARPMMPVDKNGELIPRAAEALMEMFENYVLD